MAVKAKAGIPVYDIDQFVPQSDKHVLYRVEVFNKRRNFKVSYPHRHGDFYEVLFITKGTGRHVIDFLEYEIVPDTIFFLSPGQIHELDLSDDIEGYIVLFTSVFYHFDKSNPYRLFELPYFYTLNAETPPLYLSDGENRNYVESLFQKALFEFQHKTPDQDDVIRALLDLILIHCKRLYPLVQDSKMNKSKVLVKRFKQLIEARCQDNLSIGEYATQLAVHPNYLSETVKLVTGRTSTDLINDRMIMEIKRMLVHTDFTVSEIAYKLHFADQSYFARYFKKLTGLSPSEFRKSVV